MPTPSEQLLGCFKQRLSADEVRSLLDAGAELDARDIEGNTPLHEAVRLPQPTVAALLIARGAALELENAKRQRPLDIALHSSSRFVRDVIKTLLDAGASTNQLIKKDIPKPLVDVFPKLASKRAASAIMVPGSDRSGRDAWIEFARAWGRKRRANAAELGISIDVDRAWHELVTDEVADPTGFAHVGKRLRELPKADRDAIEHAFRADW